MAEMVTLWPVLAVVAAALALKLAQLAWLGARRAARRRAYAAYLNTDTWRALRAEALRRDGHRCRLCNAAWSLEVHHRYYPELLGTETPDALTTLCHRCHEGVTGMLGQG